VVALLLASSPRLARTPAEVKQVGSSSSEQQPEPQRVPAPVLEPELTTGWEPEPEPEPKLELEPVGVATVQQLEPVQELLALLLAERPP
jgi:hypothetical protein